MNGTFDTFKAKAEAVSAEVHSFASKSDALAFICDFVRSEAANGNGGALWADCTFLSGLDPTQLMQGAPRLSFEVTREAASQAKVGISQMDWGIANTGTLVQDASAVEKRLVSTLPLIHVALLPTAKIVADLPALLSRLTPQQTPYISLITGPSRTADIERVLTIGVHGPKRLIICAIDDLA
jgi:L-lactate dehydrogenase complex protein LldG